ncbi:hypothetical protein Ahy_B07g088035 [Arachis hypogaea]|uniref:Ubiquitin-like protease family profile domain-containing protein n=1 Tax=Arachis hypogaea TaxID=3818 RepID=A0A444YDI6_ARAHY|nr:hypothetical protein Ahy_B07g088035 [Arachis hypogaea]
MECVKIVCIEDWCGRMLTCSTQDEDDHMSLARRIRLFQQRPRPHDAEQAEPVCKGNHKSPKQENTQHTDASPHTPPAAHVQLSDYDFDREFDISIVQCPEFEKVMNNVEKGCESKAIIMQPLQTILPNKSGYYTPSPGRPSFSLDSNPFSDSINSSKPKKIKLGETKKKKIRTWIVDSSLNGDQDLAKYEGREYMILQRKDFWSLKPRNWVNSCVIQWMCYSFNDTNSSRFKRDFYCVSPGILESVTRNDSLASFIDDVRLIYAGLSPSFGEDTRFFDKVVAAKRKWVMVISLLSGGHWRVYAFEVNAKRIAILDSLHSAPVDDERDKLDVYVGRLCEDMASIAIPGFVRSTYGPARSYAKVPMQPNNFDCGMCVIKLMERWTEDRELYEWDQDSLSSYRIELMLDIICGQHNALIQQLISFLEATVKPVQRNAPRNKKKDVSSPYTAPSTRSLIERAEELPKGAIRKGRKKLLT